MEFEKEINDEVELKKEISCFYFLSSLIAKKLNFEKEENIVNRYEKLLTLFFQENNKNYYVHTSKEELDKWLDCVVCYCLLIWMENSPNTKQTVSSFSRQDYALTENQIKKINNCMDFDIHRCYRSLLNNRLKNTMELKDAWKKYQSDSSFLKSKVVNGTIDETSFIDLCFCEALDRGQLDLFSLTFYRQLMFQPTTKKNKSTLHSAYEGYLEFLKETKLVENDMKFVIRNLLIFKLEFSFRWIFAAAIDNYIFQTNLKIDSIPDLLALYYQSLMPIRSLENLSPWVCDYDSIIEKSFTYVFDPDQYNEVDEKVILRTEIGQLIFSFNTCFPEYRNQPWTGDDFKNVADYFRTKQNFLDSYISILETLLENRKSDFSSMKDIFETIIDPKNFQVWREYHKQRIDEEKAKKTKEIMLGD